MTHYIWQVSDQAPLVRIAMAAAWAYFVATVAASAGLAAMSLFTDWAFANDFGSVFSLATVIGCMVWYPAAQLIAVRAPARNWQRIGFLMLLNIYLITIFMMAAGGMIVLSAGFLLASAMLVIDQRRNGKREPTHTPH